MSTRAIVLFFIAHLFVGCGFYNDPLWGPESKDLTQSLGMAGTFDGNAWAPNIAYLTVYPNPRFPAGGGKRDGHNIDLVFIEDNDITEVVCDAGAPTGVTLTSTENASPERSITLSKLSFAAFSWGALTKTWFTPNWVKLSDSANSLSSVDISAADGDSFNEAYFDRFDPAEQLVEGFLDLAGNFVNDDDEAETHSFSLDSSDFIIKYCTGKIKWPKVQ
ncbi:MAG: hypothetical protein KBD78_06690 [Oligoflexales bacterium]|nr:hypothetical protein [Oligoflexales bacterium]